MMDGLEEEINNRLWAAHIEHGPLDDDMKASGVITEEYYEVIWAIRNGINADTRAELMDLAVACLRRVLSLDAEAAA